MSSRRAFLGPLTVTLLTGLLGAPALHAQVYQFSYGGRTCNVFVPETVDNTNLKAVLLFSNGSGENRQYMPQMPWVQEFARAQQIAVIGHSGSNLSSASNVTTTTTNVNGILAAATTASGRSVLVNAPLLLAGMSSGGISSSIIGLQLPARTLGFASWRGTQNNPTGISATSAEPISMSYNGEIDGNPTTNPGTIQTHFNNYRALASNTGRFAFPATWNAGHDDSLGQSWDMTAIHLAEALRLRHSGGALSTTPGTYLTLNVVPFTDGFLAERATYSGTTTLTGRPAFPSVYPVNSYAGAIPASAAQASWLPSAYAALAYQAFTSTDSPGLSRKGVNLANGLLIESPARFQTLTTTDTTEIVVNARELQNLTEIKFYLDGVLLGAKTDGDWRWPLTVLTAGHHSAIVIAKDSSGNQRGAFTTFSVTMPPASGNTFTGAAGANLGAAGNWSLGTGTWASRQQSAAWETKTETKSALLFDGASAAGQYNLSVAGFANTPFVHGLVFKSAPGANGFTLSTNQNLYLGYAGIRNLDDSTQTLRVSGNEGLELVNSQTWAALNGDLAITPLGSDARITLSNPNDPWSPTTSDLTLYAAAGRTVTISTPIRYFGSVIKEGPGLAVLDGTQTFADNFYGWRPVVGDTLAVMQGTLKLGPTADFIQDAGDFYATPTGTVRTLRAFVADRSDALWDLNGRPIQIASLNGGGQLSLGAGGSLTLSNQYEFGAVKLATGTAYRGSISGGSSGQNSLVHTAARTWNSRDGSSPPAGLNFDLTLAGNSSFLGRVQLIGGKLNVGHGNALGATGAGNETIIPTGSSVQLIGANMNIPEDFTFNTAADAVALSNAAAKFSNTSGADVAQPTPAAGSNTLSGALRVPTVLSSAADQSALLVNEAPNTTLTLAGTVAGQDWSSGGTGKSRLVLGATAAGTHFTVPGLIANGGNGSLALALQKSGAASPLFRISGANTYSGGTTVQGGTLLALNLSGSATGSGAVTVASGAALGGSGTISGPVTLQSGAGLAFTLATTPAGHAKLNLGSTLAFSGSSTLAIVAPAGATTGTYPLLTATGGITGTLPTLGLPSGWAASLQQSGGTLNLVVTAVAAPSAPSAPTGLSATTSGTSILLSWIDTSANEAGFKLERSPDGATGWAQVATPDADTTTISDSGLTSATKYYYRLRATNAGGDSVYSAVASATTTVAPPLPAAPSGLAVTPGSSSQLSLTWTDNASNESGYKIERSPNGATGWTTVGNPGANAISFSDSGLTPSTLYYYRVRSTNAAGDSAYTAVASAVTDAPPAPPSAPSGLAATANSTAQITVTWTDTSSTETGFKLERSLNGATGWTQIAALAANTTSYVDTALSATTAYYYRLLATNAGGDSAYSSNATATTLAAVQLIAQPFADANGTAAGSLAAITGVTSTSGVGSVQTTSTLAYPGVLSSGRGFATSGGRFFMTLNTALPALASYVSGGRIGGTGTGVLYVSWLAKGINPQEADSVEFRTGTSADSDIVINIGTTFGNDFIRAMSASALNGGIANYATSTRAPNTAGTDLYVAKFTFGAGATTRVDVFVNQTTEGTPTVTTIGYGQFNVVGFAKFGGAANPSIDEFRFAATYADAVPLQPATPAPTLGSISPSTGPASGGTAVTLTGTDFTGATSVTFGGVPATSVSIVNATTVTVASPSGSAGPVSVAITTPGGTATLASAFTYLTALQSWYSGYGLPTNGTGNGAPGADPDGDGAANLLEYALGTSPTNAADSFVPAAVVVGSRLQLSFPRTRGDVTYLVESSPDLANWTNIAYAPVPVGQTQTVQDTEDLSAANPPRRFLRLRVTSP